MIRIVTDSSCDLPDAVLASHGITAVPLSIRFGDEELVDRDDLSPEEFWAKLASSADLPETAAPSPGRFAAAYGDLAAAGATGVVAVCISSALSGTMGAAEVAAGEVAGTIPVTVVDSRLTSGALGLVALAAAAAAARGDGLDEVAGTARSAAERSNVIGALDTLEFLKRGGRVGGAQAMLGSLLNVKPLITLEGGVVVPAGRVRTRRKAMAALTDRVRELPGTVAEAVIVHGAADDVDDFATMLAEVVPPERTTVSLLGPVVGTHAGPGLLGVCYRLE